MLSNQGVHLNRTIQILAKEKLDSTYGEILAFIFRFWIGMQVGWSKETVNPFLPFTNFVLILFLKINEKSQLRAHLSVNGYDLPLWADLAFSCKSCSIWYCLLQPDLHRKLPASTVDRKQESGLHGKETESIIHRHPKREWLKKGL